MKTLSLLVLLLVADASRLLAQSSDLSISAGSSPNPVALGSNLTYTISIGVPAGGATGLTVTNVLPPGVTYVSGIPNCTNNQGTVVCLLGAVGAGTATATIVVTPTTAGTIKNVVGVIGNEYDPNMANNHAVVTTVVGQPVLRVMTEITELCVAATIPYVPQRYLFVAAGGTPPYTWSMSGLPTWMTFDPLKRQLDIGAPPLDVPATVTFTATVSDAAGRSTSFTYNNVPVISNGASCGPIFKTTAGDIHSCPGDTPHPCFNAQRFDGGTVTKKWQQLGTKPNGDWGWNDVPGETAMCLAQPAPGGGTYRMNAKDPLTARESNSSPVTISFGDPIQVLRISGAASACQGKNINLNQYIDAIGADLSIAFEEKQADGSWLGINPTVTLTKPSTYRARLTSPCVAPVVSGTMFFNVQPQPTLTQVPADRTFCAGQPVTLTATGNVSGVFTWYRYDAGTWTSILTTYPNNTTTSSITLTPTAATTYKVSFGTFTCGSFDSAPFTLTPVALPAISSTKATPAVTCAGYPSDLSASAVNATSVKWQSWNGTAYVDIPGATAYTYRTPILTSSATYRFVASNSCATVTSNVSVNVNPVPPASITGTACSVASGQSSKLTAVTDMSYSPRFLWSPGGQTTQQITVSPATTTTYTCTVTIPTTGCWKVASYTVAVGTQITTPVLTANPASVSVCGGAPGTTLSVGASGTLLTYQWQKQNPDSSWSNVAGATAASYTAPAANAAYRAVVANSCGSVTSAAATVTVSSSQSAAIVTPPATQNYCTSGSATLSVGATGTNLTYQWQWLNQYSQWVTGYPYPSISAPSISVAPTVPTQFRVVVSNACNSVTSSPFWVSPSPPVTITGQPTGGTYCANYIYARLTVYDTGAPDITYQWQVATDGVTFTNIANARSNQYTALTGGYYRCVLTSACGALVTNVAVVGYVNCGY